MNTLPLARNSELVVQELKGELLIYDLSRNEALCLNETSKIVYQACDGKQTFDELKKKHKLTDEVIYLALDKLQANGLLATQNIDYFKGLTRREVIRKAGLAALIALPVIAALAAPTAAHAASLVCPNPFYNNIPNGCPVSAPVTVSNSTCDTFSDAVKTSICNNAYGSMCSSGQASYVGGTCSQQGTYIAFACVCGA